MPTELEKRLAHRTSAEAAKEMETRAYWAAQAAIMRDLLHYPGWEAYSNHLAGLEHNWIEKMVTASDSKDFGYAQGFIAGLRTAHNLPQAIITKTEQSTK
jgi:hypothetical protein